jgi:pantetheine-phosphate adenylyltransferase
MKDTKVAVFPGFFDPVTRGHEAIVKRAIPLFEKIIVAVGNNTSKANFFPLEKRMEFLEQTFQKEEKVVVMEFSGLTVDFCRSVGASVILRGLRSVSDFEYEKNIAQMNRAMVPDLETLFLLTDPEFTAFTSTIARDIIKYGGNIKPFVPVAIHNLI